MYLSDSDIKALLPQMNLHCPHPDHSLDGDSQIQPCSIDLRVSDVFWRVSRRRTIWRRLIARKQRAVDLRHANLRDLDRLRDWKQVTVGEGDTMLLKPGQIVMGRIYERFRIPEAHAGKIEGRSSFARLGLMVHCTGDFINPGWQGFMPLQLFNAGPYPLRIPPYFPVCQLMLVKLSSASERNYGDPELQSKYVNDDGGPSLWWRDASVRALQQRLGRFDRADRIQQEIVSLMRDETPEVIGRFQDYMEDLPVAEVDNGDAVLQGFATREKRIKMFDRAALYSPGIFLAAVLGSLFAGFGVLNVVLIVATIVSCLIAARAYVRRDDGYLDADGLNRARNRPGEGS